MQDTPLASGTNFTELAIELRIVQKKTTATIDMRRYTNLCNIEVP